MATSASVSILGVLEMSSLVLLLHVSLTYVFADFLHLGCSRARNRVAVKVEVKAVSTKGKRAPGNPTEFPRGHLELRGEWE